MGERRPNRGDINRIDFKSSNMNYIFNVEYFDYTRDDLVNIANEKICGYKFPSVKMYEGLKDMEGYESFVLYTTYAENESIELDVIIAQRQDVTAQGSQRRINEELFDLAKKNNMILMEAIKTAYATAFSRLILLIKGGKIGEVVSIDATCTSLNKTDWSGFYEWAPTALLPIFELLGTNYQKKIITHLDEKDNDIFTKIDFVFEKAVASIKVGDGIKSEGQLVISGTKGYIYVPAPWWKTDYFEIRYENSNDNKRYFYQLDGEGIRYELVAFARAIESGKVISNIKYETSLAITEVIEDFHKRIDTICI